MNLLEQIEALIPREVMTAQQKSDIDELIDMLYGELEKAHWKGKHETI
jgi:hypothetical protein